MTPFEKLPSRIKHYLLEWKDANLESYCHKYGELKVKDMSSEQLSGFFYIATLNDIVSLKKEEV